MDTRRVTRSLEAPTGDQFHSVMELSLVYLTCPRDLLCVGLASKDLRPYVSRGPHTSWAAPGRPEPSGR